MKHVVVSVALFVVAFLVPCAVLAGCAGRGSGRPGQLFSPSATITANRSARPAAPAPATTDPVTAGASSAVLPDGIDLCQAAVALLLAEEFGFAPLTAVPWAIQQKCGITQYGCEYDDPNGDQDAILNAWDYPVGMTDEQAVSQSQRGLVDVTPVANFGFAGYFGQTEDGTESVLASVSLLATALKLALSS